MVGEMSNWIGGQWVWDFGWWRQLFVSELDLLDNLLASLNAAPVTTVVDS
jgi:hypothetical protein